MSLNSSLSQRQVQNQKEKALPNMRPNVTKLRKCVRVTERERERENVECDNAVCVRMLYAVTNGARQPTPVNAMPAKQVRFHHTICCPTRTISGQGQVSMDAAVLPLPP